MSLDRLPTDRPRNYDKTGYDARPCQAAQALVETWSAEQPAMAELRRRITDSVNHVAGCGVCRSTDVGDGETRFEAITRIAVTVIPLLRIEEEG